MYVKLTRLKLSHSGLILLLVLLLVTYSSKTVTIRVPMCATDQFPSRTRLNKYNKHVYHNKNTLYNILLNMQEK